MLVPPVWRLVGFAAEEGAEKSVTVGVPSPAMFAAE